MSSGHCQGIPYARVQPREGVGADRTTQQFTAMGTTRPGASGQLQVPWIGWGVENALADAWSVRERVVGETDWARLVIS
jgi:hypothetical protein